MRHIPFEPMEYHNQQLMDELNEFCVALKIWLYTDRFTNEQAQELKQSHPKPELSEIDSIMLRLLEALKRDAKPMRRY